MNIPPVRIELTTIAECGLHRIAMCTAPGTRVTFSIIGRDGFGKLYADQFSTPQQAIHAWRSTIKREGKPEIVIIPSERMELEAHE